MILKTKKLIAVLSLVVPLMFAVSCGDEEDEEETTASSLTGTATASCTLEVAGITTCTEVRNASDALATETVNTCNDSDGTGASSECANKSAAPGVCTVENEGGTTNYIYQSGDVVTQEIAESSCTSSEGTFTAN